MVFFASENDLKHFQDGEYGTELKNVTGLILADVTEKCSKVDHYVRQATTMNSVTLFTRMFGRGSDFGSAGSPVSDDAIRLGGVHVIQAFLSEERSEEVQIRGRTARAGNPGTYQMILRTDQLTLSPFKADPSQIDRAQNKDCAECGNKCVNGESCELKALREKIGAESAAAMERSKQEATERHKSTKRFRDFLALHDECNGELVRQLLSITDRPGQAAGLDILCVIDESFSMSPYTEHAREYARAMLDPYEIGSSRNRCGIVAFGGEARALETQCAVQGGGQRGTTCLTGDRSVLLDRINSFKPKQTATNFFAALKKCEEVFEKECGIFGKQHHRRKLIIFQTDGGESVTDDLFESPTGDRWLNPDWTSEGGSAGLARRLRVDLHVAIYGVVVGCSADRVCHIVGDPDRPDKTPEDLTVRMDNYTALVKDVERIREATRLDLAL